MTESRPIKELFDFLSAHISEAEFKTAIITAEISSRITKERIDRNMTQKEFADFLGVSQPMISKWESGDYNFTISAISDIFDKLNLDYRFDIIDDNGENVKVVYKSTAKQTLPNIIDLKNYGLSIA